jgi:hypothetical protein
MMSGFDSRLFIAVIIPLAVIMAFTGSNGDSTSPVSNTSNSVINSSSITGNSDFPEFKRVDRGAGLITNSSFEVQDFVGHAGVYVNDFNGDGWEDLLVIDGREPVLFENSGGEYRKTGFLDGYKNVASAHFFDHDKSGDEDLLLLRRNEKPVFLDNNNGSFERKNVGIEREFKRPYGALTADYNRDGCIDILITQWGGEDPMDYRRAQEIREEHPENRPDFNTGYRDYLYEGDCGSFSPAENSGLENTGYPTFTGSFVDFNDDRYPDIHLANDFARDILYRNNRNSTFTAVDMDIKSDRNAMSSNVADLNGDLEPDIFVTNVYYPNNSVEKLGEKLLQARISIPEGNNAFINTGSGFEDRANQLGLRKGGWGWGSAIADFSNDGNVSVLHTTITSHVRLDPPDRWGQLMIFQGNGETFERVNSTEKGFEIDNGRGLAKLDYNNDGSLDLVKSIQTRVEESSKHVKLYRNKDKGQDFLQVILNGEGYISTNTEFYLNTTSGTQYRILDSRSDMLSQGSPIIHFGLGEAEINSLRLEFPDGETKVFDDLERNTRYRLYRSPEKSEIIFSRGENSE